MNILGELHAEGHTIIIVTHDMQVASTPSASSRSGWRDRRRPPQRPMPAGGDAAAAAAPGSGWRPAGPLQGSPSHGAAGHERAPPAHLPDHAGHHHRHRLGGLGGGAGQRLAQQILADISAMGTNTIDIFPGPASATCVGRDPTLTPADADALAEQSFVDSVTPSVSTASTARYGNISVSATSMAWASSTSACAA
jgi:macrolide transport system ATP-binding/permease protein